MSDEIVIAIIGAVGVVIAAWIGTRFRGRNKKHEERAQTEVVGRDKVGGDVVGRDKVEAHEHIYLGENEAERKNGFVYFLEKLFAFVFTFLISGAIFGGIGMGVGQEVGGVIGLVVAFIFGIVNAGNVKRTKGLI